jgi:hypothetical protein
MQEHQPEPDELEVLDSKWGFEGRTVLSLMIAPGLLGAALVVDGLTSAAYVEAGVGVLLLVSTPIVARWVSGAIEPMPRRDR